MTATRVPPGAYLRAAKALMREDRMFDKYTLAERVTSDIGRYVDSRRAAAWIRSEHGWVVTANGMRSGVVQRTLGARPGPIASGGVSAAYVVTASAMRL